MNAHINFDLPQALLAVITDEEFDTPALVAKREEDHRAIDRVLASRVAAEDDELVSVSGPGSVLNRLLRPLNQRGSQRFLRESREKVWANAVSLSQARRQGPDRYAAVLAELEELSAAKVSALTAPGFVLLKLAVTGFGVRPRLIAANSWLEAANQGGQIIGPSAAGLLAAAGLLHVCLLIDAASVPVSRWAACAPCGATTTAT